MASEESLDRFGLVLSKATGHETESTVLDPLRDELTKRIGVLTQVSYPQISGRI